MTAAEKWITRALGDHRTVTFRELSREIGCHVHASKNFLKEYLASHPDVTPTYLLSGTLLSDSKIAHTSVTDDAPATGTQSLAHMSATQKLRIVDMDQVSDDERNSEADAEEEREEIELEHSGESIKVEDEGSLGASEQVAKWGVVLAAADVLDDKKKLFENASIHIYALSPAPVKDPAQFVTCALNVREHGAHHDPDVYGTITGDPLVAGTKPLRDGGMDFTSKKKSDAKAPEIKKEIKKEAGKIESRVEAKKVEPKKEQAKSEAKSETRDRAAPRKSSNKRRIVVSDDEEDDASSAPPSKGSSSSTAPASKASSTSKLEPTSSMVRAEDQAAMEAMMGMDIDFEDEDTAPAKPPASAAAGKSKSNTGGGKRKTRRVKKSKVEMDDKGYMVTKDYYTDETCSGSDTDTDAATTKSKPASATSKPKSTTTSKPKAPTPAIPASGGPGGGARAKKGPAKPAPMGQSTLAGFFKKK